MNFLRKILLITIIAWSAGSVEATVSASLPAPPPPPTLQSLPAPANDAPRLDFNNIITFGATVPASFQPKIHARPTVGTPSVRCIYFTVSSVSNNVSFGVALHQVPNVQDHNIYFPIDGQQPTTPEAVKYSCANVDVYNENSPITEWYMKMFGVMPINQAAINAVNIAGSPTPDPVYIQAGWDNARPDPNVQPIISFDASVDGTIVNDPNTPSQQISRLNLFKREFRKIASTSVGRVLLYRILIEIRRHKQSNVGCFENEKNKSFLDERNLVRSIILKYSNFTAFYKANHSISFVAQKTPSSIIEINESQNAKYDSISFETKYHSALDVNIFHELGHWFHFLRDSFRFEFEGIDKKLFDHFLGKYLWDNLDGKDKEERIFWSSFCWHSDGDIVDFEEMRNIVGTNRKIDQSFEEGDDICENLYRSALGLPLRFGHETEGHMQGNFFEDKMVTSKIVSLTLYEKSKYPIHCQIDDGIYKAYQKIGLGNFKCYRPQPSQEQSVVPKASDPKSSKSPCSVLTIDN